MDEEGFIYFKQRLKRMIVTSGYNVYPSQIENVLDAHPDVLMSTVIGVKDDYKMQRVKAFIVPKPGVQPSEELKRSILDYCSRRIAKYAIPGRSNSALSCPIHWWARWPTPCWRGRSRTRPQRPKHLPEFPEVRKKALPAVLGTAGSVVF